MNYMGIDHHKQYSPMTLMAEDRRCLSLPGDGIFILNWKYFLLGVGNDAVIAVERSSYVIGRFNEA